MTNPTIIVPLDRELRDRVNTEYTTLQGGPCVPGAGISFGFGWTAEGEFGQCLDVLTQTVQRHLYIQHLLDPLLLPIEAGGILTIQELARQFVSGTPNAQAVKAIAANLKAMSKAFRARGVNFNGPNDLVHVNDEFSMSPGQYGEGWQNDVFHEVQRQAPYLPDFKQANLDYFGATGGPGLTRDDQTGWGGINRTQAYREMQLCARMCQIVAVRAIAEARNFRDSVLATCPITIEEFCGAITVSNVGSTTVYETDWQTQDKARQAYARYGSRLIPFFQPDKIDAGLDFLRPIAKTRAELTAKGEEPEKLPPMPKVIRAFAPKGSESSVEGRKGMQLLANIASGALDLTAPLPRDGDIVRN